MEMVRYDGWRALRWGSVISLMIAVVVLALDTAQSPFFVEWRLKGSGDPLHPVVAVVASIFVGMGVGSQLSLWLVNRHRWRAVLRPSVGRVICGLLLVLLCPFAQIFLLPVTLLFPVAALVSGDPPIFNGPAVFGLVAAVFPVGYFFASLMISGVRSRLVRVALFGQFWLMFYGAATILFGVPGHL